ncbi:MAG: hypothetical protein K9M57_05680 [Phycisphaerae bacterium]|nr:hypothetical protein [Phycisphaerae bacterium]
MSTVKRSPRIRMTLTLCAVLLAFQAFVMAAGRPSDLVRGEDRVDVPASGAGFCLHNLFQSNMVIQREKPIGIWGWASPGEIVKGKLDGQQRSVTAGKDRRWKVTFPALPASSRPREIIIQCKDKTIKLENILVGDLWVLGGQSNMEHPICRTEDGSLEIASANFRNIRILTVPAQNGPKVKQDFPRLYEWHSFFDQHYRKGDWDVCTPKIVEELSAIGYVFARRIHMASQVPIGVIDVSRGGSCLETWLPIDVLKAADTPEVQAKLAEWDKKVSAFNPQKDLADRVKQYNQWAERMKKDGKAIPADRKVPSDLRPGPAMDYNRPGNCYASMIAPIAGLPVKGAIWHQGYSNASQEGYVMYYQLFGKMIEAWRANFEDQTMAFGIISLCTDGAFQTLDNYLEMMVNEGQYIRQVQYQTYLDFVKAGDKNVGFASSYDMRRAWYHPGLKVPVGERIARWALSTQYGKNIEWKPPLITGMNTQDGQVVLTLDVPVDAGNENPIEGFAIAGKDRRFQPAKVEHRVIRKDSRNQPVYDYKTIVLSSPYVADPIHFRYAWGRNPMGNLKPRYNFDAAPLATQRSDDWKIYEVPVKFGDKADWNTTNLARQANRLFDMDRRLKDARHLLDEYQKKNENELTTWKAKWETGRSERAEGDGGK